MPTIDIDRDAAHEAAQRELGKPIYPRPSLTDQILDWIDELLYRLVAGSADVPGGWFTVSVLLMLLGVAVFVAVRIARRAMRTERSQSAGLFDGHELTAAEHRATAEAHAATGEWAAAIRHRLRAVARQLEENGVLEPVPGRTATELARTAGRALPALTNELFTAAEIFNDVTYGERPGLESQYRMIASLDSELGTHTARRSAEPPATSSPQTWAEVR
ncbi:Uncharacterised protein [Mycolicibacterium vanbaalenii]|uniref:Protein-glutamine gamma-glutamyltransferase-like C-terminal domain-containing protein n=1 Tax=Mycolicibacterium vanbaalenii TaxID=110539 RepID=A0A5S9N0M4_MYCVN|nr:DUF4129 domain-containing protein [Mycolicibacterium vanbaalenii]CAA0082722.1 Uncharacterised protein [Mycolicibacterium vanbaalenii]